MMSFKEYRSVLYKSFFKFYSFRNEIISWNKKERIRVVVFGNIWSGLLAGILGFFILCGIDFFYLDFNLQNTVYIIVLGVVLCMVTGVVGGVVGGVVKGLVRSVVAGVVFGVVGCMGIVAGVVLEVIADMVLSVTEGVVLGVTASVVLSVLVSAVDGVTLGVAFGVGLGVAFGAVLGVVLGVVFSVVFGVVFTVVYLITIGRFWYFFIAPLYKKDNPLWWDENIGIAVPYLPETLKNYAINKDFDQTLEFTLFLIEKRPVQRKSAQKGLILITLDRLKNIKNFERLQVAEKEIDFLPKNNLLEDKKESIPKIFGIPLKSRSRPNNFYENLQNFIALAEDINRTENDLNYANRVRIYEKTKEKLDQLRKNYLLSDNPLAKEWTEVAIVWYKILDDKIEELRKSGKLPLPNPYVFGKPASESAETFVGRQDIIEKIQTETLRDGDATTILFIGNRRTGKSSTLLNLQPHVQSSIRTVFCDMQNAEFNADTATFCDTLSDRINVALHLKEGKKAHNFAELTRFLQSIDQQLLQENRHLLICIDEYERIQQYLGNERLAGLPDSLRHWIQHLRRVVFLLAGSNEPSELKGIDWTDYLINVRNVPISYLERDAALKLVTNPVSYFDLTWSPENLPEQLIDRLGCQPYLIQCTMSCLVEMLNRDGRKNATREDIDKAIHKILGQDAKNHFDHFWITEMSEESRAVLLALTKGQQPKPGVLFNWLKRREILKESDGKIVFCVPVLAEWIQMNAE